MSSKISLLAKDIIFEEFRKCLKRNGIFIGRKNNKPYTEFLAFLNALASEDEIRHIPFKQLDLPYETCQCSKCKEGEL